MAKTTTTSATAPIDPSYQFKVGDLIEYRWPKDGSLWTGRIVDKLQPRLNRRADGVKETRIGYAIDIDGVDRLTGDAPYFADPRDLRLRPDLEAARADNAFQEFLSELLTAPRRGARKSRSFGVRPKPVVVAGGAA